MRILGENRDCSKTTENTAGRLSLAMAMTVAAGELLIVGMVSLLTSDKKKPKAEQK